MTRFTKEKKVYWIINNCTWSVLTQFATYFGVKLKGCVLYSSGSLLWPVLLWSHEVDSSSQQFKRSTITQKWLARIRFKRATLFSLSRTHTFTPSFHQSQCRQWIYSLENWLNLYRNESPIDSNHSRRRRFTSICEWKQGCRLNRVELYSKSKLSITEVSHIPFQQQRTIVGPLMRSVGKLLIAMCDPRQVSMLQSDFIIWIPLSNKTPHNVKGTEK